MVVKQKYLLKTSIKNTRKNALFSLIYRKLCSPNVLVSHVTKKAGNLIDWKEEEEEGNGFF